MSKIRLSLFVVFSLALAILIIAHDSRSVDLIYSGAQYRFTAERQSFFPQTCVRFRWAATYYTTIDLNGEPVESPGEKTICEYGDVKRVLTVVYQDGNPLTYGLRIPGGLGFATLSIVAMGGLLLISSIRRAAARRRPIEHTRPGAQMESVAEGPISRADHLTGRARPILRGIYYALTLLAPLAVIQAFYPAILRDSWRDWALYWLYLTGGVIAPGTLLLLMTVHWRADWLTWIGLGWAVGHGVELVALLIAKQVGVPVLFAVWIPLVYALVALRRQQWRAWQQKFEPLERRRPAGIALAMLVLIGTVCFVSLNLAELSPRPPYVSDVWFHINNAHEFRDHGEIQDPRLAGEPFNYHLFSYAPTAAASLITGAPVANLLARNVGLSSVWLLSLLLFNAGRVIGKGRALAGFFSALLIILPLDVFALMMSGFAVGTFLMFYGVYMSTTTLGGFIFLAALLLPFFFEFQRPRLGNLGVIVLLTFAGAGAKSMFGPLIVCAVIGTLAWQVIVRGRRDRQVFGLLAATLLPVAVVTLRLVFGENTYAESIQWSYAHFSRFMPYYIVLTDHGWSPFLASTLWPFAFTLLFLIGAVVATWRARRDLPATPLLVFVWLLFGASLVPALAISLQGKSQLFFLYYGLAALSPLSGYGFALAIDTLRQRPRASFALVGLLLFTLNLGRLGSVSPNRSFAEWTAHNQAGFVWRAFNWASDAFLTDPELPRPENSDDAAAALGPYGKKLILTDDVRAGLVWARSHLPKDAVFAVNVPDAAAFAGYSERRAFMETAIFTSEQHLIGPASVPSERFGWRYDLLDEWRGGQTGIMERFQQAGVTHLFVDRVNGFPVAEPPASQRIFSTDDFAIYRVPTG